ncbi:MAG: GspE/PulE family protein [Eubacteriales bacterium]
MIFNKLFTQFLIDEGVVEKSVALEYCDKADAVDTPIYIKLVESKMIEEEKIYQALADYLGYEYRFCQLAEIDLEFVKQYPRDLLLEYQGVPFELRGDVLTVLCSNPFRIEEFRELLLQGGKKLNFIISPPTQMKRILDYANNKIQQDEVMSEYINSDNAKEDIDPDAPIDAPVIKLCDSILKDAINRGASDIHIEPFAKTVFIRFRIDGKLNKIDELSPVIYPAILARYKIMSELNIAERRVPQDGKISLDIEGNTYDFRVSTLPTIHGEKIVIRIYSRSFNSSDISSLGFSDKQKDLIMGMITRPHGIILLTGPTGSGKSTTLYTFLRYLAKEDTNIMTVEDPVENEIVGINQVQVNTKANLTFAAALRSFLRQDPNVIMIGEIRDEETAQIATRAAITGHLVLSSIHTNDAAGVITRLINMGIPKYLVADSLLGAISQRLVRKLCPKCKKLKVTDAAEMAILKIDEPREIYEATGCLYCNNTGYLGRIGVFEIMILTDEIKNIIMSPDFMSEKVGEIVERDMTTVLSHTRERVLLGQTSLEEYDQLVDIVK